MFNLDVIVHVRSKMNVKFERNRLSQYVQSLNVNHDDSATVLLQRLNVGVGITKDRRSGPFHEILYDLAKEVLKRPHYPSSIISW